MRHAYTIFGSLFLIIGIVGVFVPLLPTTPFLLLAAFCYSRGSERFYNWLLKHRFLGPPIQQWKDRGIIRLKIKLTVTGMFLATVIFLIVQGTLSQLGWLAFAAAAIGILIFIWTRPGR